MARALPATLSGSWRSAPPPLAGSTEELERVLPGLLGEGLAGLAWQRLRHSPLAETGAAMELRNAYRHQALQQRQVEISVCLLTANLRAVGAEFLVLKGPAVAQLYPEPALRPYGDLDLVIRPNHLPAAQEVIRRGGYGMLTVDLDHADVARLAPSIEDLFDRSERMDLDGIELRVLAAEDQLAHLCLHYLRHGAERPLWLVDIAVAVENRPARFDWNLCFGSDPWRADAITCAIGTARQLIGADVAGTPVAERAQSLPGWLVPAVLAQWEREPMREFVTGSLVRTTLLRPWTLPRELAERWPDPIRATAEVRAPFNELPRFPFQAAAYVRGLGRVLRRLPALLRTQ